MKIVGIKKVYYSVSPDMIVCERVKDMISIQASSVTKMIYRKYYNAPENSTTFFKNLLIDLFPKEIKKNNFEYFIEHNLKFVLPEYSYRVKKDKKTNRKYVNIIDDNNCVVCSSYLL